MEEGQKEAGTISTRSWVKSWVKRSWGLLFALPCMSLLFVLLMYPLARIIGMSVSHFELGGGGFTFSGLDNFARLLQDTEFWNALQNSVVFTTITVVGHFVVGTIIALLLTQVIQGHKRLRDFLKGLFMIPWLFATVATATLWTLILTPNGLADGLLSMLRLSSKPLYYLGNPSLAMPTVIAVTFWQTLPFVVIMICAGLESIPAQLYEVARIDGANALGRFVYITVPQLRGILTTVILLDVIWRFNTFDLIFLTTAGGPLAHTETLALYLYRVGFRQLSFGYASAIGIAGCAITFAFTLVYLQIAIKRGLTI